MTGSGSPSRRLNTVLVRPLPGETREEFKARLAAALFGVVDAEEGSALEGAVPDTAEATHPSD